MKKAAILFISNILLTLTPCTAQEVTITFKGETLSEALRQLDQTQNDKRILFLFDDLEMFTVTAAIDHLPVSEAVRKVCNSWPVSVTELGDNIFVEYVPKIVHLNPVEIDGKSIPDTSQSATDSLNIADHFHRFDVLAEEVKGEESAPKRRSKSVSVVKYLTTKGFKITENQSIKSYEPNQPISKQHYTEEDYGNPEASIQRLERTDGIRFHHPTPSQVVEGTFVNGYPTRWNIKVPKDFPAIIYEREITSTKDVGTKYVKSIYLIDCIPTVHPYVEIWVELRHADEIQLERKWHK